MRPKTEVDKILALKVSAEFKKKRKELGLNQEAVASYIGLNRTAITNIENGNQQITAWQFIKFMSLTKADLVPTKFAMVPVKFGIKATM